MPKAKTKSTITKIKKRDGRIVLFEIEKIERAIWLAAKAAGGRDRYKAKYLAGLVVRELEKRFKAICENIEGAAIAQVCAIYKIPMLEIRGISNIVGERDKRKWNLGLASENSQKLLMKLLYQER